ncbi:predicted protein [Histoplasma mississippiense (nom. inval.)]|nr:predicted protein [Histoplasma mississippiense (nom. inval.)]EDN09424.1 predicted protein [Histoplasma mississippiense (nom. inval.)]
MDDKKSSTTRVGKMLLLALYNIETLFQFSYSAITPVWANLGNIV